MPATITHAFFTIDVYDKLKNKDKLIVYKDFNKLKMFGQSTDSMMFYNIESLKKGKKLRKFQKYFHTNQSQEFFITLCKNIKSANLVHNSEVIAFLYGFICHYVLDSNIHPFVIYKTGYFDKKKKETYKYNNLHSYMETFLDNEMVRGRTNNKTNDFRLDKFCFDTKIFSDDLNNIIDKTFDEVFRINNMSKIYYKSLKQMKIFLRKYRFDKYGIKRFGYKIIDLFTTDAIFKFEALSYNYKPKDKEYFLNNKHSIWYNPIDIKISSHDSFDDLYKKSIDDAVRIIDIVNVYFNDKEIDLKKVFINKSYISGLDCNVKLDFKKFYF